MTKPGLPSIDNELAAPRQRVDLKSLKNREPMTDEAVQANSHTIGKKWGATTQLPIDTPSVPLAPVTSIRGYIPQYLDDEKPTSLWKLWQNPVIALMKQILSQIVGVLGKKAICNLVHFFGLNWPNRSSVPKVGYFLTMVIFAQRTGKVK